LIKGFTIRRLDSNKIDPTSCGVNGAAATSAMNTEKSNTNVSERDLRINEGGRRESNNRNGDRDDNDGGSKGGASSNRIHSSEQKFGVYIKEGRATIEECDMMSECGTVVFCNPRSHTKLVRNIICGSVGSGVMVTGKGARILAEDNHIFGSTGCGIDVRNNASCTLVKNKIHNCDKSGIYVLMTGDARIFRNEIWENHFSGIEVTNAQKVEIINNKIYQNKRAGLYFHTESDVFVENNEIIENKNANVIMKEKSRVKMVHNYIARSIGSGLVILTGSGCIFDNNIIESCLNNGIDLCNGDIYASKNIIVDNERSGLYGNGHIKGYFQMNKVIGNKLQSWNNGLCKYIMDQDGSKGSSFHAVKNISKERFVMYRNIDDCELKSLEYAQKHVGKITD
jgi:parallel beta-helix repeat protein